MFTSHFSCQISINSRGKRSIATLSEEQSYHSSFLSLHVFYLSPPVDFTHPCVHSSPFPLPTQFSPLRCGSTAQLTKAASQQRSLSSLFSSLSIFLFLDLILLFLSSFPLSRTAGYRSHSRNCQRKVKVSFSTGHCISLSSVLCVSLHLTIRSYPVPPCPYPLSILHCFVRRSRYLSPRVWKRYRFSSSLCFSATFSLHSLHHRLHHPLFNFPSLPPNLSPYPLSSHLSQ